MKNEIEYSLEKSFKLSNLADLSVNYSELALDSFLKDGTLKEIPFIGTIFSIVKIGLNIRDIIYLKKILRFLFNFSDTPECERNELIEKFDRDAKSSSKFGEYLMILIDNMDNFEKTDLVAKCFKAYLQNKITYTDLLRLNHGISQLLLVNINELTYFYTSDSYYVINESALQNLGNSGFIQSASPYGSLLGMQPSELGEKFMVYALGKNIKLRAAEIKKKNEDKRNKEKNIDSSS